MKSQHLIGYFLGTTNGAGIVVHYFKTADGNMGVMGKPKLDKMLKKLPLGHLTKVSVLSLDLNGKDCLYSVEYDLDDKLSRTQMKSKRKVSKRKGCFKEYKYGTFKLIK